MDILIAIAHIVGSIVIMVILGFVGMYISTWETEKNQKQALEEVSVALGVTIKDLDNEELMPKLVKFISEKFSNELFRNRFSDFCGLIRTLWGWLGSVSQIIILLAVVWFTFTENIENALYAWFIVGLSIFFWVMSIIFSLLCKLLTGRYPGEAKQARKVAAEWVNNNA